MISLILSRADNGVIGKSGALPWRLPADMRRFKALTLGKPCLMGRKTWESLPPKFRPLPGRANIVISRNPDYAAAGATVAPSFASGLDAAMTAVPAASEVMVIGGAAVYAAALPFATRIYLTEVHVAVSDGDAHFPALDTAVWRPTAREDGLADDGISYSFLTLERAPASP